MKPLILSTFVILAFWPGIVEAQQEQTECANRIVMVEYLKRNYQEIPVAMGLIADDKLLEVFVSTTGSWSILVTSPNGISCGVAYGLSWESTDEIEKEDEL